MLGQRVHSCLEWQILSPTVTQSDPLLNLLSRCVQERGNGIVLLTNINHSGWRHNLRRCLIGIVFMTSQTLRKLVRSQMDPAFGVFLPQRLKFDIARASIIYLQCQQFLGQLSLSRNLPELAATIRKLQRNGDFGVESWIASGLYAVMSIDRWRSYLAT